MACSLIWPFLHCQFGTWLTEKIDNTGFAAYGSNWYELPIETQKYILMIVMRSQEDLNFTGLGMTYCTIETLGKVSIELTNFKSRINIILIDFFIIIFSFGILASRIT